jgi:hypothetical protein
MLGGDSQHGYAHSAGSCGKHIVLPPTRLTKIAICERNLFYRDFDGASCRPAALPETEAEVTCSGIWVTKDLSSLRIDHVSTKSSVLGVRRSQLLEKVGRLLDNAENFMQYV